MTSSDKKLFLLDAFALIYRSYYAFIKNPRYNSKGLNTSAMLGFTNTLDEVIRKQQPSNIAVVFDPPSPTFRHEMYKEYKAQRPPTPEDIKKAVPYIKQIIEAFNIPMYEVKGYEADDTIGTLAKKAEKEGYQVFMMTPDKDYCQLVSENIFLYKPKRFGNDLEIWGTEKVCEKFNVKDPRQVIDVLALWGDASDNVPGVQGIGEKTSKKLIGEYGNIETIYENLEKLKPAQKRNFEASRDLLKLSRKLIEIVVDVPIEFNENETKLISPNKDKLIEIFEELEFKTLARRILAPITPPIVQQQTDLFGMPSNSTTQPKEQPLDLFSSNSKETIKSIEHNYINVDNEEKQNQLLELLSKNKEFCFDTETTGLNVHLVELVGVSFSFEKHKAWYLPIPANREKAIEVLSPYKQYFQNEAILKIGQNIKFDIMMLRQYDINTEGKLFDTMLAHYLLHPEQKHNLDYLSEVYLNYTPVSIEELIGKKGKKQGNMRDVSPEIICEYASEDADLTLQLKEILEKELANEKLDKLFYEIEMPLIPVLVEMELTGVKLDTEALSVFSNDLKNRILGIEKEIYDLSGEDFNISSPKQLGIVLFEKMKIIENPKKTKTKQYSTSEQELQKIKDKHPIIEKILEYRSLKKLLSTYVDALPLLINIKTKKIHTSYNQGIVATGRLSSNNPNLQNIPIRTVEGREIRKAFIPSNPDNILLAADYSQIELRLIAHISKDEGMVEAFNQSEDIHSATAAKIYNIELSEVDRDMRARAKSANFGIVYGISAFGLSQNLQISRSEAKELIDGYFHTYPKVKKYMEESIHFARHNRFVETVKGRKRALPDIDSRNAIVRGVAERNAINAPIQGSAADIIKIAMINVHNKLNENNLKSKLIMQVHDELVFDVCKDELEKIKEIVKTEMENALTLSVPLSIDMGIGNNWLEAH